VSRDQLECDYQSAKETNCELYVNIFVPANDDMSEKHDTVCSTSDDGRANVSDFEHQRQDAKRELFECFALPYTANAKATLYDNVSRHKSIETQFTPLAIPAANPHISGCFRVDIASMPRDSPPEHSICNSGFEARSIIVA
jgi:hypothetical protein